MIVGHTVWAKSTEGAYLISITGDVYSLHLKSIISKGLGKGYVRISHGPSVHRQVALLFLPEPLEYKKEVNHKNGIRNDNKVENLEWVSSSENAIHSHRTLQRVYNCSPGGKASAIVRQDDCILENEKLIGNR